MTNMDERTKTQSLEQWLRMVDKPLRQTENEKDKDTERGDKTHSKE